MYRCPCAAQRSKPSSAPSRARGVLIATLVHAARVISRGSWLVPAVLERDGAISARCRRPAAVIPLPHQLRRALAAGGRAAADPRVAVGLDESVDPRIRPCAVRVRPPQPGVIRPSRETQISRHHDPSPSVRARRGDEVESPACVARGVHVPCSDPHSFASSSSRIASRVNLGGRPHSRTPRDLLDECRVAQLQLAVVMRLLRVSI